MQVSSPFPATQHAQAAVSFVGVIETTMDALRLVAAARNGLVPRLTRRMNEYERRMLVKSGAVFCYSIEESGVRRFTDGKRWTDSRIHGNFLVYREIVPGNTNVGGARTDAFDAIPGASSPITSRMRYDGRSVGTSTDVIPVDCFWKKAISFRLEGTDYQLISYYSTDDLNHDRLSRPTTRPDIMSLVIIPSMIRVNDFRHPPSIQTASNGTQYLVDTDSESQDRRGGANITHPHPATAGRNPSTLRTSSGWDPVQYQPFASDWTTAMQQTTSTGDNHHHGSFSTLALPSSSHGTTSHPYAIPGMMPDDANEGTNFMLPGSDQYSTTDGAWQHLASNSGELWPRTAPGQSTDTFSPSSQMR